MYFAAKVLISAVLVALISEIAKRSTLAGGLLASVPLVSVLAMIWLYVDTRDSARIAQFSLYVFWLVLPSLVLFLLLPLLLKLKLNFYGALALSLAVMVALYGLMVVVLRQFGVKF